MNSLIDAVARYWDARPCNIRHSLEPVGTRRYWEEVEARKYFVESHIPAFAEFEWWRGRRVLEVGCGVGTDTISFLRNGAYVTAIDCSYRAVALTQRRALTFEVMRNLRCSRRDIEACEFVASEYYFDLVYAFGVLHHTPNPLRALFNIRHAIRSDGTLKVMLYHRRSWKVLTILLRHGWRWRGDLDELVAHYSEAQPDCPIARTYTKRSARRLLESGGFEVTEMRVAHIFPWRIRDYVRHRYLKVWWFRWMPARLFAWLERRVGWHLLITATPI